MHKTKQLQKQSTKKEKKFRKVGKYTLHKIDKYVFQEEIDPDIHLKEAAFLEAEREYLINNMES